MGSWQIESYIWPTMAKHSHLSNTIFLFFTQLFCFSFLLLSMLSYFHTALCDLTLKSFLLGSFISLKNYLSAMIIATWNQIDFDLKEMIIVYIWKVLVLYIYINNLLLWFQHVLKSMVWELLLFHELIPLFNYWYSILLDIHTSIPSYFYLIIKNNLQFIWVNILR